MISQLMKEDDLSERCYCGRDLSGKPWVSDSRQKGDVHYKVAVCDCGCEIRVRVDFRGSGHDSWNDNWYREQAKGKVSLVRIKTIDNIVKQVK